MASLEDRIRRLEGRIGGEAPKDQDEAIRHSVITLIAERLTTGAVCP